MKELSFKTCGILFTISLLTLLGCASLKPEDQTAKTERVASALEETYLVTDIASNVSIGDTLEHVTDKVGAPTEIIKREELGDGTIKITALYNELGFKAGKTANDGVLFHVLLMREYGLSVQSANDMMMLLTGHPEKYLITFTGDRVTAVEKRIGL